MARICVHIDLIADVYDLWMDGEGECTEPVRMIVLKGKRHENKHANWNIDKTATFCTGNRPLPKLQKDIPAQRQALSVLQKAARKPAGKVKERTTLPKKEMM
ncbi:MAG TPA: hypothetical protein VIY48_08140 [Candidatus Paceibacterota bacterium]